ncbi:hypothetical protein NFI96_006090 [Prochilodus magdalenae]|nr:hypothetical protein NFI96_006090 [Prochilodus magdalenae]
MAHDPATLASPDLLSDLSDLKQDLFRMSTLLTMDLSEQSLDGDGDGGVPGEEAGEPFQIVGKVKEDLETVGEILVGARDQPKRSALRTSRGRVAFVETGSEELAQVEEPIVTEIRITRAPDSSSPPRRDASEMVSHLTTDLEHYLQEIPVGAHPDQEGKVVEETFTEVVLPRERRRNPPRIKKPARRKLRDREFASGSSEDELERMSSEESLDGDAVLIDPEVVPPGPAPVSPKVVETPIGSIKDRVKALQKKVEEEGKEESLKTRVQQEPKQTTPVQSRSYLVHREMDESYSVLPKSPKSPRSQTERIEETMSVRELMKAFQTGQDPSKSKSGLFEHKALSDVAVPSTGTPSQDRQDSGTLETRRSEPETRSESRTRDSPHDVPDAVVTPEDQSSGQNMIQAAGHRAPSDVSSGDMEDSRAERRHTPEETVIRIGAPDEQVRTSEISVTCDGESSAGAWHTEGEVRNDSQWSIKVEEATTTPGGEEGGVSIDRLTYQTIKHERRTSEEPQISPDRRPSEDFSAVIKEELEDSPEYQLFKQDTGSAQLRHTFSKDARVPQDGKHSEQTAAEYRSYKPNPVVRFATAVVHSAPFVTSAVHEDVGDMDESLEKTSDDEVGVSPGTSFGSRTPRTSLGEEFIQTPREGPEDPFLSTNETPEYTEKEDEDKYTDVSSFKTQKQREGARLHETEQDGHGWAVKETSPTEVQTGVMDGWSPTDVQEQVQPELEDTCVADPDDEQPGYTGVIKESSPTQVQTGTIKWFSPTEVQDQVQTELEEDEFGAEGRMKELSITEFQEQVRTELEGSCLHDTQEEDLYGHTGMMKELTPADIQEQAQTELEEDQDGFEGTMKGLSRMEFQEQVQTGLKGTSIQDSEEEEQHGYTGMMEEVSPTEVQGQEFRGVRFQVRTQLEEIRLPNTEGDLQTYETTEQTWPPTEIQTQAQTELREDEYGVKGTAIKLSLTEFQDQAQTELREDEYGVEGTAVKPSLTEFQDQVQTELREGEYGVEGTAIKLSLTEFQDQAQTELRENEYGIESTMKELSLTEFQDQAQTELREDEYGVEGTAIKLSLTEFQDQAQTELREDEYGVEGTMKEPSLTEFQDQAQTELREDEYGVEGTMKEPSLTEFQDQAQTELREDEYGVEGTMKEPSLTEFQDQAQTELREDEYGVEGMQKVSVTGAQTSKEAVEYGGYNEKPSLTSQRSSPNRAQGR